MIYNRNTLVQDASNIDNPTFQYPITPPLFAEAFVLAVSPPRLLSVELVLDGREAVPVEEDVPEAEADGDTADVAVAVPDADEPVYQVSDSPCRV